MLIAATVFSSTPGTRALASFSLSALATLGNRNFSAGIRTSFTCLGGGCGGGGGGGGRARGTGGGGGGGLEAQPGNVVSTSPDTRKSLTVEFTVISKG
jgi:hypothetical protein